jgi:hypothetical protein
MKPINHIPSLSSPPFTFPSYKYPPTYTVPILQSCLSLLIPKPVFKVVFQCVLAVNMLYFWSVQPPLLLSLTPSLPPPVIQQLSVCIIMFLSVQMRSQYCWLSFSFLSSLPTLHSVVRCCQHILPVDVYIMFVFCVYLYLLDLLSKYRRKHVAFVFLYLAYFT